jgi:catechol 2,3-dioxygenase-like lactoylglutathione lyase family enzyme
MEKKIITVMIGVTDMQRAVDFYRTTLGLPLKFQTPTYSEFKTGGAVLALQRRAEVCSEGACFSLPTTNIKKDLETLRRKKVKFWKDLSEEPYGSVLMPKDSEGNIFEIVQHVQDGKSRKRSVMGMFSRGKNKVRPAPR